MGVISGIGGLLNGVSLFQQFSVTSTADLKELMHAGTAIGGKRRIPGVLDWNGTYNSYGAIPDYWPGDTVAFLGSIDGSVGLSGQCMITQQAITFPISTNDPISHVGTFRGDGPLTRGAAVVAEPAAPAPPTPEGLCPELSPINLDAPAWAQEENTYNVVITLTIEEKEYVDCSTNGVMNVLEGGWDASMTYDRYVDDFALLPDEGEAYYVRQPIDNPATQWYEFQWMRVADLSNMQVNRETGDLVSGTVNLLMSALETVGETTPTETTGQVITPGPVVWRPLPPAVFAARRLFIAEQGADKMAVLAQEGKIANEFAERAGTYYQTILTAMQPRIKAAPEINEYLKQMRSGISADAQIVNSALRGAGSLVSAAPELEVPTETE